ncbi:MAG: L-seryl-tRNA(Sec) selenium transferase [Clostridiales bacterium]|nr:L-seryl-tRNA(Sec) selenium transferase [Clostridiales bacterium]
MDKKNELLRQIPKIDEVLKDQRLFMFFEDTSRSIIVESVREVIEDVRQRILNNRIDSLFYDDIIDSIVARINSKKQKSLRQVINCTGTIIHTNLGRAILSKEACKSAVEVASNYSTLEYNLKRGSRGSRHEHVDKLITKITGVEAAMVVNNNAAAVFLCLSALAKDKDVIVSRGELVEIGGSFRIPEIMELSGARLVEVGTTNKTNIEDYRRAIIEGQTGLLLKVHTSNFKIVGFTKETTLNELVDLGREASIPVIYDIGSGLMTDLSDWPIHEPTVIDSLKAGIDIILFSGDKLLGGPQAGIIAGKKKYVDMMKEHPLARVVRVDKMTLAALEATFYEYIDPEKAKRNIPVLSMISVSEEELKDRAYRLMEILNRKTDAYELKVVKTQAQIGGGSAPNQFLPSYGVSLKGTKLTIEQIERRLREHRIPVIVRIYNNQILLDMRTLLEDLFEDLVEALLTIANETGRNSYA